MVAATSWEQSRGLMLLPGGIWMVAVTFCKLLDGCCHFLQATAW